MVRAIGNHGGQKLGANGEFTPSSATKMLPLVRRIVDDILRLDRSIEMQREQIRGIDRLPEPIDRSDYRDELADIRESLAQSEKQRDACLDELASLGVLPHEPFDGSVDFPAMMDRRQVRLCWRPEDQRVEYWHEVGQPQQRRQKLGPEWFSAESLN